ncbi:MAG: efflux RND transporter periplasmic adaptor subunit [Thermodesulfobacteriota bacterium]
MVFKQFFIFLILIFLILPMGCGSRESKKIEIQSKIQSQNQEERSVEIYEVVPQNISYPLSAIGSLKSPEIVRISPKKAGIIQKFFVKEGDFVKKGQVLVQLDDVDARLQLERAEARVWEAKASLETNRNTLQRYQKLLESKVISQQTFDDLRLKVRLDEARVALAETELNLAKQNLLDHKIFSSIDGAVNLKIASPGEHVNVAPKDEILTIVQMDPLDLEFYVPEQWVEKIRLGTKILFKVKAFSEEKFFATLYFISPTADSLTRNVKMKASAHNPHYRLKPGFFAEVTIPTVSRPNAIVLPESSLLSQEGKYFAFIVQDGIARRREVETGMRYEGRVEILKGIQKGEKVVKVGHEQLREGTRVKIIN